MSTYAIHSPYTYAIHSLNTWTAIQPFGVEEDKPLA